MLYKLLFFLLIFYEHFEHFFACDLVHIMQSNAHIFMCDSSNHLPVNCTVFWSNNILSFCISNSFHTVSNFSTSTNLTNLTNTVNNFIPPMFPSPPSTTPLPSVFKTTTNAFIKTTTLAPSTTSLFNTTTNATISNASTRYKTKFRSEKQNLEIYDFTWLILVFIFLMCFSVGIFLFCKRKRRKKSVLPFIQQKPMSKTKIVASKLKAPVPNKYLHVKDNLSMKPEFSFEEVVQLKRMLSKKKKKQKMKKYVQRLRVLPPIISSKKVTPSGKNSGVFLVDHSWKTPPSL